MLNANRKALMKSLQTTLSRIPNRMKNKKMKNRSSRKTRKRKMSKRTRRKNRRTRSKMNSKKNKKMEMRDLKRMRLTVRNPLRLTNTKQNIQSMSAHPITKPTPNNL